MKINITQTAQQLSKQSGNSELHLRFISELQSIKAIDELKKLLAIDYPLLGGLILERIKELLPEKDAELYLSLALWNYFNGLDDEAIEYWKKAKIADPTGYNVLVVQVWLNYNMGAETIGDTCDELLALYPDDTWGKALKRTIVEGKPITEMILPSLNNPWEDAIRKK